jgi:hypothetical protein
MTDRRCFLLGFAALAIAPPGFAKVPFKPLFDGKSLAGWIPVGNAKWLVEDGILLTDQKANGALVSAGDYSDFELHTIFWVSPEANSGVFIRCSDRAAPTQNNAYEINIFDNRPDPSYGTGAIVETARVAPPLPKAGGRWNDLLIRAQGDRLSVTLNGRKTVDNVRDGKYRDGPIALQYGSGVVKFRKVELRSL